MITSFPDNKMSVIEEVQLTGYYQGREAKIFHINGRRSSFTSTSSPNDIKQYAPTIARMATVTSADALEIVSSNAADSAAGTGVRTLKVTYINSSNDIIESPAITLNGTTPVPAGFTANEILWMESDTVGSNNFAVGNIVLRKVVGAEELEMISAVSNKSFTCKFMVPLAYKGYILKWDAGDIQNEQDFRIVGQVNSFDGTLSPLYRNIDVAYIPSNNFSPHFDMLMKPVPALARIKVTTITASVAVGTRADVGFSILIIKD